MSLLEKEWIILDVTVHSSKSDFFLQNEDIALTFGIISDVSDIALLCPLSDDECFIDICDKEKLCDSTMIIPVP